jgi:hypothetical protein
LQVGEELCIDYVPVKKGGNMRKTVQCDCGSSDCRVRSARVFAFCHSKLISSFAGLDFLTGSRFTCCSDDKPDASVRVPSGALTVK